MEGRTGGLRPAAVLACALGGVALAGCFGEARGSEVLLRASGSIAVVERAIPAASPSRAPRLAAVPGGGLVLSWVETSAEQPLEGALHWALLGPDGWEEPRRAARGGRWVVQADDAPALVVGGDGELLAHYRTLRSGMPLATDLRVVASTDAGTTWMPAVRLNSALERGRNGFVELVPDADGWVDATWMEGGPGEGGAAALRWTRFHLREGVGGEGDLERFPCPGCAPDSERAPGGDLLTAFRARRERRVRDVVLLRRRTGGEVASTLVAEDGWPGASCGGDGPALAVRGDRVAVAWLGLSRDGRPRVLVAVSRDGGWTFDAPVPVAEQMPQGRVDVALLPDDSLLVSWLEVEREAGEWRLRRVTAAGEPGRALALAPCEEPGRAGAGRLAAAGADAVFAWTDPVHERVRSLLLEVSTADTSP